MDRSNKLDEIVQSGLPDVVARLKASGDLQGILKLRRDPQTAAVYQSYIDLINEKGGKILSSAEVKAEADNLWNLAEANNPFQQYKRLLGEVDARNTQRRMDMTLDQRRQFAPWSTWDVPEADQIVRMEGGPAMFRGLLGR